MEFLTTILNTVISVFTGKGLDSVSKSDKKSTPTKQDSSRTKSDNIKAEASGQSGVTIGKVIIENLHIGSSSPVSENFSKEDIAKDIANLVNTIKPDTDKNENDRLKKDLKEANEKIKRLESNSKKEDK